MSAPSAELGLVLAAAAVLAVALWLGPTLLAVRAALRPVLGPRGARRWQGPAALGLAGGGVAAVLAAGAWAGGAAAILTALLVLLPILAAIDLAWRWLPLEWTVAVATLGLGSAAIGPHPGQSAVASFLGAGLLLTLQRGHRLARGTEGLGTGDIVLIAGLGLFLTPHTISWVLVGAASTALLHALWLRRRARADGAPPVAVAFGAHLCAVTILLLP